MAVKALSLIEATSAGGEASGSSAEDLEHVDRPPSAVLCPLILRLAEGLLSEVTGRRV